MENSSETIRFSTDAFEDSRWLQLMHENAPNCGGAEVIYAVPRTANLARPHPLGEITNQLRITESSQI